MKGEQKFFRCKTCGNIVGLVFDAGTSLHCCAQEMEELLPNTVDAAAEKHVPMIWIEGAQYVVQVGETEHPMLPEHYIAWVYLQTERGGQRKALQPGEPPVARFALVDDKPVAAYAFCNLHGLWKKGL